MIIGVEIYRLKIRHSLSIYILLLPPTADLITACSTHVSCAMQAICDVAFVHLLPKQNSTAGTVLTISETVHDKQVYRTADVVMCGRHGEDQ